MAVTSENIIFLQSFNMIFKYLAKFSGFIILKLKIIFYKGFREVPTGLYTIHMNMKMKI